MRLINLLLLILIPGYLQAASISLSSTSSSAVVGSTITVNILLNNSGLQTIDGVEISALNYNPTQLQLLDSDTNLTGLQITANPYFLNDTALNSVDATNGKIKFSRIATSGNYFNSASALIASINFKVLAAGSSRISINHIQNSSIDSNITYSLSPSVELLSSVSNLTLSLLTPVGTAPIIKSQPISQTVLAGQSATFTVIASGSETLSYQWYKNGVAISSASSPSYTTPTLLATDNGSNYSVKVSNSLGSVNSQNATLSVISAPSIISNPQPQIVNIGSSASFAVSVSGTAPFSYQWRKNGVNIIGANFQYYTTPALTSSDNAALYNVVVTNQAGSIISATALLTVNGSLTAPSIIAQPADQTIKVGMSSTFKVSVTGSPTISYQWQKNGVNISGATTSSYTTPTFTTPNTAIYYSVVVKNNVASVVSRSAKLVINATTSASCTSGSYPNSLIPVISDNELVLLNPNKASQLQENDLLHVAHVSDGDKHLLAHLATSEDHKEKDLSLAFISEMSDGSLEWRKHSKKTEKIRLGKKGDLTLACYADSDSKIDLVALNSDYISIQNSDSKKIKNIPLRGVKTIKAAQCSDLNSDGKDELVIHYSSKKTIANKQDQVEIFDLNQARKTIRYQKNILAHGLALLDIDQDHKLDICTYSNRGKGSKIDCILANSEFKRIELPIEISQLKSGSFNLDNSSAKDAFIIKEKNYNKIYLVNSSGDAIFTTSAEQIRKLAKLDSKEDSQFKIGECQ